MSVYEHHVVRVEPGRLGPVSAAIRASSGTAVATRSGRLFGAWKPIIGLSLNHVVVVTEWPDAATAAANADAALAGIPDIAIEARDLWQATLRPRPGAVARTEPGVVTHRWYDIREADFERFLGLSSATWGNWEGVHDGEVLGLWRTVEPPAPGLIRMRLMAWYRDMGVWERSRHWKGTKGAETANQNLGQRYDLTVDSAVSILVPLT